MSDDRVPWWGSFLVDGDANGSIHLRQVGLKQFELCSTIRYVGARTGLEGAVPDQVIDDLRTVGPHNLGPTDLTSVPPALRWFVSQYGAHTPAALIHDRLIGIEPRVEGLTDEGADRYFRVMLADVGVPWIRRWLMWAAVAFRTRYQAGGIKRASVLLWLVTAVAGMAVWGWALVQQHVALLVIATLAPLAGALLWWPQYGAGVAGAYAAPWLVPPTLFGFAGFLVYAVLEATIGRAVDRHRSRLRPAGAPPPAEGVQDRSVAQRITYENF